MPVISTTVVATAAKKVALDAAIQVQRRFPGGLLGLATVAFVVVVSLVAGIALALVTLLTGAVAGAAASATGNACGIVAAAPSAVEGIPAPALDAYQRASTASGIPWYYLAGIGKIESQHGQYGGRTLTANGTVTPPVIGIPLNGSGGTRAIRDTDGGRLDGDRTWDRAVGPMQFIPSTWATQGQDGNLDGVKDPQNMYDAILATAFYLKAHGAPDNMDKAFFAYNHSTAYVDRVMAAAAQYQLSPAAPGAGALAGAAGGLTVGAVPPLATTVMSGALSGVLTGASTAGTAAAASAWTVPMKEGTYTITSRFGPRQSPGGVGSTDHKGTDYGAPVGTPIYAIGTGTVVAAGAASGYGQWVKIDHGSGVVSIYGHVSQVLVTQGQQVTGGTLIAKSGNEGTSTGPHLHFQVEVNGTAVDPLTFLAGAGVPAPGGGGCGSADLTGAGSGSNNAWGGYQNGRIPADALCSLAMASAHRLRCDAAAAVTPLNAAYKARFGKDIAITDSYRSYESQVRVAEDKPGLAAAPGTSNHGWGLALDLGGGIQAFGTEQYLWMRANAPAYGWVNPEWAHDGVGKEEPWHWEFAAG